MDSARKQVAAALLRDCRTTLDDQVGSKYGTGTMSHEWQDRLREMMESEDITITNPLTALDWTTQVGIALLFGAGGLAAMAGAVWFVKWLFF